MGFQEKKKRFLKSLRNHYKKMDLYGKNLTLTFEGEDQHHTYVGATLTTCIMIFLIVYGSFQLQTMFNRSNTKVNEKNIYVDLTTTYTNYTLQNYGFDFAVQLTLNGIPLYDETYFNYKILQVYSYWAPDKNGIITKFKINNNLIVGPWTNYQAEASEIKRLGINKSFYWASIKNYTISGSYAAPVYQYLSFALSTCTVSGATNCKSASEISTYMKDTQLSLFYTNFYFDSNDFVKPIKSYIDDKYWFAIIPTMRLDADVFVRYNTLSLQDGFVQISGDTKDEFMSVPQAIQRIDDFSASDGKFVRIYFRVDPIVTGYNRQVYSSGDFFAQIGGVYSFLYSIGAVIVYVFSEKLFVAALSKKLYQIYDERNGNKYDESDKSADTSGPNTSSNSLKSKSTNKVHNVSVDVDEENKFFKSNPIRNLIRNTMYWKYKSDDISNKLKEDKDLDDIDIMKIKSLVTHRKRLEYNSCHVLEYYLCWVYFRKRFNRKRWKRHILLK